MRLAVDGSDLAAVVGPDHAHFKPAPRLGSVSRSAHRWPGGPQVGLRRDSVVDAALRTAHHDGVSRPSPRFLSLVTRSALPEMVAPTYAKLKNLDANEAYTRLEQGLSNTRLLDQVQLAVWQALEEERAGMDEPGLVAHLEKRLAKKKTKRFKPAPTRPKDEGAWVALSVALDHGAGMASGEALDLIESPGGQELLRQGFRLLGHHLAKELLR